MQAARVAGARRSVRLTLPLRVGAELDTIELEPAHYEWLVRIAAYAAVRDGLVGLPEAVTALVLAGKVRERHGDVRCLESLVIELRDDRGREVGRVELPRDVLHPFVVARAAHRVVASGVAGTQRYASSLHASNGDDEPWRVEVPALPSLSVDTLATGAAVEGTPAREWIATFVHPDVLDGFDTLEAASRAQGVEAAGRIHTRVGFDRKARAFVRILERLVVTRDAVATGATIVSSAGSWGDFLASVPADGPSIASHVHTHLHLAAEGAADATSEAALGTSMEPIISVADRLTHLTTFPDPLAAGVILSLYPARRVVTLFGYAPPPRATFDEEPGFFVLPRHPRRHAS